MTASFPRICVLKSPCTLSVPLVSVTSCVYESHMYTPLTHSLPILVLLSLPARYIYIYVCVYVYIYTVYIYIYEELCGFVWFACHLVAMVSVGGKSRWLPWRRSEESTAAVESSQSVEGARGAVCVCVCVLGVVARCHVC